MPGSSARLDRRAFLTGVVGTGVLGTAGVLGLAGCTTSSGAATSGTPSPAPGSSTPGAAPTSVSPTPSPSAGGRLPAPAPWEPSASEVSPAVKVRAVRLLEALGTWSGGPDPTQAAGLTAARARIARLGYDPALADQATVLLAPEGSPESAVVRVVDAQYGGILSSSSSVLVVLQQWRTAPAGGTTGTVVAGGTTVDVRLVAASPRWRVTALHPASPSPPAAHLDSADAALLADPRLHLPVAAHADLRSGTISAGVLHALQGLVDRHVVDVSVVKSGHPLYVFGTNRLSDHPRGHAVDVWAIDGHPVVAPANRALVESVMRLGISLGAYQVGGPVDLDGGGSLYFTDNTHHDHIHLGFHT